MKYKPIENAINLLRPHKFSSLKKKTAYKLILTFIEDSEKTEEQYYQLKKENIVLSEELELKNEILAHLNIDLEKEVIEADKRICERGV